MYSQQFKDVGHSMTNMLRVADQYQAVYRLSSPWLCIGASHAADWCKQWVLS